MQVRVALARELRPGVAAEGQHVAELVDDQRGRRNDRRTAQAADRASAIRASAHRLSNSPSSDQTHSPTSIPAVW